MGLILKLLPTKFSCKKSGLKHKVFKNSFTTEIGFTQQRHKHKRTQTLHITQFGSGVLKRYNIHYLYLRIRATFASIALQTSTLQLDISSK